ncbi:MAG: Ig-like domain-containing protein [Myxococcota bacterium]|nr:Ig-like domain-containing protein [Myxococcota bacterium]
MTRLSIATTLLALLASAPVAAQDGGTIVCDDEPVARQALEVFPADNATAVSLDAPVRARYSPGYFEPGGPGGDPTTMITLLRCPSSGSTCFTADCADGEGEFVPGRVQVLGEELVFMPSAGWEPETAYRGIARGVDATLEFSFCTGTGDDAGPPRLGVINSVTSTVVDEERCDAPRGSYRISVFFEPATELGPPGSVEYLLYQTRGTDIDGPVLRDRVRNFATDEIPMAFALPPDQATSPICVTVAAVDGVGNVDYADNEGGEVCVDPVQGNFFESLCSVSAPGGRARWTLILAAAGFIVLLLVVRLRSRCRP